MKRHALISTLLAVAAASASFTGCKTTEENYRAAYTAAVEKQNEGYTDEEILAMAREEAMPKTLYKGDSIPMKGVYVNLVKTTPAASTDSVNASAPVTARRYNVVVATFKQRFNANSVLTRLQAAGYPDAILLRDRDDLYYVAAMTTNSLDDAVATLRSLQSSSPVSLKSPCPYILRRP